MRLRSDSSWSATRSLSAMAGVVIGYGFGAVWLRLSPIECLVCMALGGFVTWVCSGPPFDGAPAAETADRDSGVVVMETLPLLPTLSWPATFPVETTSAHSRATSVAAPSSSPRCVVTRRRRHARLGRRVARTRMIQHCRSF